MVRGGDLRMHERHWGAAATDLFYQYLKICLALAIRAGQM